jgi:hypothetical protein
MFRRTLKILFIYLLFTVWFLSDLPPIWKNPRIPPEISQALADTADKTFIFTSDSESWTATTSGGSAISLTWSNADGSPSAGSLRTYDTKGGGGASTSANYWQWTGTWEDLGVSVGNTVTQIRGGYNYRVLTYGASTSQTGPLEFRTGGSCTLQGELLGLASISGTVGWTTRSQGSNLDVPLESQASNSAVCIRLNNTANLGGGARTIEFFEDTIFLTITHEAAALLSVSISPGGNISYGTIDAGQSKSTIELSATQTATNDGTATENLNIKTSNAVNGTSWSVGSSAGSNVFVHEFSTNSGSDWTIFTTADSYQTLTTNLGASNSVNFDLRITVPTDSDNQQKTITITVQAVEP